jgi:ferredoxin-fold anticodon binding domain-containing protein
MIGKHVLVRTYSAGVHFGVLEMKEGKEVILNNARRIWRWFGANTLNEIAINGVDQKQSKISVPVPEILLTEAIEIIPMSDESIKILENTKWAT